ncbi:hypothetical protein [Actinophytocola xanthii]|uniref:ESX-1 secretion-associated protein n=1 Tax=Actinophytocola xanthii TaxID=1912961 RepID=A0A1Q8CMS2_9PSEU|nr:hypothetical protein [Actinophytocola xanthii]OLF15635.1 hypothetical protein BU204_21220 [Actinophytocola xanthii]
MSTPPSNNSSTAGPGGVAPPDGYTTDTGQMSGSARTVTNAAEDAQGEVKDLHPTELTAAEFGTKHTQWHADYAAAIEQLGAGAAAMCANTMSFGGQLGGAGQSYEATEAGATNTVTAPGSGQ